MRRIIRGALAAALLGIPGGAHAAFTTFESGQVRPLALSPDGTRLFAVNTPDDRLEIFDVTGGGLAHVASVPVGLEPVAVAARSNTEVWVVNHLSDSVSIVDVGTSPPVVARTLLVGDEPRDIVFAGPGAARAFITTAHRGQNRPGAGRNTTIGIGGDAQLLTAGVGRADVWVFDATGLGTALGGVPITIVTLFGDTPRALATNGNTVWAAVFQSGNQTTTLPEGVVCNGGAGAPPCNSGQYPGGLPAPNQNVQGTTGPETGLIVKFDNGSGQWRDTLGRNWNNGVKFSLPDQDVFAIDATANPPVATGTSFAHVGTVLFNMAVNPVSGRLYVSNTDARNEVRFEGPGILGTTVRGHLAESRITVIDGATVTPRHLNKHINYAIYPSPPSTNAASLATPTGMAVTSNGQTLYVAAFGSSSIGVFSTAQLEANTFTPDPSSHWPVTGGGPSGLVLDEANGRLFVLTRFDNAVSMLDSSSGVEQAHVPLYNPEPASVVDGRPFLYDAAFTSSNGEAACASCHIFGDFDSLAWDLGNPDDVVLDNLNPFRVPDPLGTSFADHHPLKGPMTTQSLRGMANAGPMHWRGDRSGANNPGGNALDEDAAFKRFNVAFAGLLGRGGPLAANEMQAFTDFILQVTYPPNPIRALDDSLTADQLAGRTKFFGPQPSDVFQTCNGCHVLDPSSGHFGTDGFSSFEFEPQLLKIPHLRNLYQKVGMFGMAATAFLNPGNNGPQGPQVRGFGFLHDGSVDTVFRFHQASVFNQTNPGGIPISNPGGFPNGTAGDPQRRQMEQFMLAFDSNLPPVVGQQVTLDASSLADSQTRVSLLIARATANECDLVVKGVQAGEQRGWVFSGGAFQSDRLAQSNTDAELRAQAATEPRTYTAVPHGEGTRIGIDRDEDGFFDHDEIDAGSDPADPSDTPTSVAALKVGATKLQVKNAIPDVELKRKIVVVSKDPAITPPTPGGGADPRCNFDPIGTVKARLRVVSATSGESHTTPLPCQNWTILGSGTVLKGYRYRDAEQDDGTAKIVTWKPRQLKATLTGKGPATTLDYDLQVGVDQGEVAARFDSGTVTICLACTPYNGKSGADGKTFLGKTLTCPAPAACASGSPSGAFVD